MSITIRQARPDDASAIYNMIYELAVYEKAPQEVVTTPDEIRETLFGDDSKTEALICEIDGKTAGYAVFFTSYSTRSDATVFIWKICISHRIIAARARVERC